MPPDLIVNVRVKLGDLGPAPMKIEHLIVSPRERTRLSLPSRHETL
jgi:hypothetical protein